MVRLPLVASDDLPMAYPSVDGVADQYKNFYFANNRLNTSRVFRALANNPAMHDLHVQLACTLWSEERTGLTPKETELITIVTGRALDAEYEWQSHATVAMAMGFTRAEVASVGRNEFDALEEPYGTLATFVDAYARREMSDEIYEALLEHYSEYQASSVFMTAGFYVLCAYLIEALGVSLPGPGVSGYDDAAFIGWELENLPE